MGIERVIHFANGIPEWSLITAKCLEVGEPVVLRMIDDLPAFPDEIPDAMWKELVQMHQAGKLDPQMDRRYFAPQRPMFELYDLANDPSESTNLVDRTETAPIEKELKAAMQEWMILQRDFLPLPVTPTEGPGRKRK